MAILKADTVIFQYGLKINQKIIPDGTVWIKDAAGFKKGDLYKAQEPLDSISYITIHNPGSATAEVFARATWNQNMNTSRIHYYVDDIEAWQLLTDVEKGWHAGDGDGPGNSTSLSVEICMGSKVPNPEKAEENGALLTAILMRRHNIPIDKVVPHKYWKRTSGTYKECPLMILPHWNDFIKAVKSAYSNITKENQDEPGEPGKPDKDYLIYTVVKGDTLRKIARRFNTTVTEIVNINNIKNPDLIIVGQKFKIPTDNFKYITYVVKAGDRLSTIAKQYNQWMY